MLLTLFSKLVSGDSRHHSVSMCTLWLLHSTWLSQYSNESASNFVLSLNIPPRKVFRWFRRLQIWATDWQLHHNNAPSCASHLMQNFLVKHQITQVTQPPDSPDLTPCDLWLFPELKSPLKKKRFLDHRWDSGKYQGAADCCWENCVRPQVPILKGLRHHRPIYDVSYIFFNKCLCFLYYITGYIRIDLVCTCAYICIPFLFVLVVCH